MGLFSGKLFDFNGDDHVDFGEQMLGLGAVGALLAAATEVDEEMGYDERESLLEDMETQLDELNAQMPDNPDSAAYPCKVLYDPDELPGVPYDINLPQLIYGMTGFRAVGFCTLIVCVVVAICTNLIISEIKKNRPTDTETEK